MGSLPVQQPYRILIAGGAYGGVSAAVNLLDLSLGRSARLEPDKAPAEEARDGIPIEIHVVDERDGYCKAASLTRYGVHRTNLTDYYRPHDRLTSRPIIVRLCNKSMAKIRRHRRITTSQCQDHTRQPHKR
jgi:hypothetical protein